MSTTPNNDRQTSHRQFSVACFNQAWDLIDKPQRTADEDRRMLLLSMTSLYHWTQRDDVAPRTLGVGCWQVARVFCLLGHADAARRFATQCLEHSQADEAFYLGYAHEAMARTELLTGNMQQAQAHLNAAKQLASQIANLEDRAALEADLKTLQ